MLNCGKHKVKCKSHPSPKPRSFSSPPPPNPRQWFSHQNACFNSLGTCWRWSELEYRERTSLPMSSKLGNQGKPDLHFRIGKAKPCQLLGAVAERLRRGLQILVHRFESGPRLHFPHSASIHMNLPIAMPMLNTWHIFQLNRGI